MRSSPVNRCAELNGLSLITKNIGLSVYHDVLFLNYTCHNISCTVYFKKQLFTRVYELNLIFRVSQE